MSLLLLDANGYNRIELILIITIIRYNEASTQYTIIEHERVYQPKVEYPLGQTFLREKHVKKIESASLLKIIAKYGYNRNMHCRIQGGPKELVAADFSLFKPW